MDGYPDFINSIDSMIWLALGALRDDSDAPAGDGHHFVIWTLVPHD
jgi:hypothetical protein